MAIFRLGLLVFIVLVSPGVIAGDTECENTALQTSALNRIASLSLLEKLLPMLEREDRARRYAASSLMNDIEVSKSILALIANGGPTSGEDHTRFEETDVGRAFQASRGNSDANVSLSQDLQNRLGINGVALFDALVKADRIVDRSANLSKRDSVHK
jgi:hypothetical protein